MPTLKLLDPDGTVVATSSVTASKWTLFGNVFQNADRLHITMERDGKPAAIDLYDDNGRRMLKRVGTLNIDRDYVARGEVISFAIGSVRLSVRDFGSGRQ